MADGEGHQKNIIEIGSQPQQLNEHTIIRKIDLHVISVVVLFYFLSFLDRTNIGNARLSGLITRG